jgi:hypothetical protein
MDYNNPTEHFESDHEDNTDYGSIVESIIDMTQGRSEFSYIDDDCDTWEVVSKGEYLLAMCPQKNALLRIRPY